MIELQAIIPTSLEVGAANMSTLTTEGVRYAYKARDFAGNIKDSIKLDALGDETEVYKRRAKAIGFTVAIGSEVSVGNESLVIGFGLYCNQLIDKLGIISNPVIDSSTKSIALAAMVGGFSYLQQLTYGRIAQSAANKYPEVIETVSSVNNEKNIKINANHVADGNIAPLVGTTLSYVAHKSKHPSSTKEQEKEVIRRGAKLIAAFWAGSFGVAGAVTKGAEKIEDSSVMQGVANVKNPEVMLPVIGGVIIAKEWLGLIYRNLFQKNAPDKASDIAHESGVAR